MSSVKKRYLTLRKKLQDTLEKGSSFSVWRTMPRGESFSTHHYKDTDTIITTATLNEAVSEFRRLISTDKQLESAKSYNNKFLLRFLRKRDMDPKKALLQWKAYWKLYHQLRLHYRLQPTLKTKKNKTIRSTLSKTSANSSMSHANEVMLLEVPVVVTCLASGWIQAPPSRDLEGRQIVYIYPELFDRDNYCTVDVCAAAMNLTNLLLNSVHTQQNGICLIFDVLNTKVSNVKTKEVTNTLLVLLNYLPVRITKVLIIGFPNYAKILWRTARKSLPQHVKDVVSLIKGPSAEAINNELDVHIHESQRLKKHDGSLDWDKETSMKDWVLNEMVL